MLDLLLLDRLGLDWLTLAVLMPLLGAVVAFIVPRHAPALGLASVLATGLAVAALAARVIAEGPVVVSLGGWGAPLGLELRADGLGVVMLAMTALVGLFVSLGALDAFGAHRTGAETGRMRLYFWPLWLLLLSGLNGAYVSTDVFNLYVMIEVIALAAIGLTVLSGKLEAMRAGFEYMVASMLGALLFLMGVGFVYLEAGRLDFAGVAAHAGEPAMIAAFALMLVGLALKTALFPLHFWLPRAHANATAPASALLSGLVLKASLYILLRFWIEIFQPSGVIGLLVGVMGTGAIVWGSVQALRAQRLKLLVAWSTVAQIGLMCVAFALADTVGAEIAWQGAVLLMVAHAVAKAAMFLAAGRIADEVGHDRIAELDRTPVRPTLAQFAFALSAISLIGLPPSAGFAGKWLLMEGALRSGAWIFVVVAMVGTLFSVAYLSRPLIGFLRFDRAPLPVGEHQGWAIADAPPLVLAFVALASGLLAAQIVAIIGIGAPFGGTP